MRCAVLLVGAASLLDALATGLRECKSKEVVGASLHLDTFFDGMLKSRISRWDDWVTLMGKAGPGQQLYSKTGWVALVGNAEPWQKSDCVTDLWDDSVAWLGKAASS